MKSLLWKSYEEMKLFHTDNKNVGSWNALNDSNENIAMTNLNTSVSLVN